MFISRVSVNGTMELSLIDRVTERSTFLMKMIIPVDDKDKFKDETMKKSHYGGGC
jgi:hypothetical protein